MDKRELLLLIKGKDLGAKKVLDDVGDAADGAKEDLSDLKLGTKQLDSQIAQTTKTITGLRKEIQRTGDLGLVKDLEKAQRELNKLTRQRKLVIPVEPEINVDRFSGTVGDKLLKGLGRFPRIFGDVGKASGEEFSVGLIGRAGPLIARAPLSGKVVAALLPAAPAISSLISGAVTAGIGLGVAGAGVALVSGDEKVKAAAEALGEQVSRGLKSGASSFVPEVVESIDIIGDKFDELQPKIRGAFDIGSTRVVPLTESVAEAVDELVGALVDANAKADPLIEVLEEHIPNAAETAGYAIRKFSEDTQNSADALDTVLTGVEHTVGTLATLIGLGNKIGFAVASPLYLLGQISEDNTEKAVENTNAVAGWDASFRNWAGTVQHATTTMLGFTDAVEEWTSANLGAENATLRLEEAIDAATDAGKKNNDGIDANTEKGRANRQILLQLAEAANQNAQAIYEQTGSVDAANAATSRARGQFIAAAVAMGTERKEAERLAGQLFALPKNVGGTVNYNDSPAREAIRRVVAAAGKIKDIHRGIYYTVHGDLKVPGGTLTRNAEGGFISGPGTSTSDSIPALLSDGEYVVNARAVRSVGRDFLDAINRAGAVSAPAARTGGGLTDTPKLLDALDRLDRRLASLPYRIAEAMPRSQNWARTADLRERGG